MTVFSRIRPATTPLARNEKCHGCVKGVSWCLIRHWIIGSIVAVAIKQAPVLTVYRKDVWLGKAASWMPEANGSWLTALNCTAQHDLDLL